MTAKCSRCGAHSVKIVDSNGAKYPETRVETHECEHGHEFKVVLTA
jgi:hypothetical protein